MNRSSIGACFSHELHLTAQVVLVLQKSVQISLDVLCPDHPTLHFLLCMTDRQQSSQHTTPLSTAGTAYGVGMDIHKGIMYVIINLEYP